MPRCLDASGGGQGSEFRGEQVVASVADQTLQWARDMVADGRVSGPELDDITSALATQL